MATNGHATKLALPDDAPQDEQPEKQIVGRFGSVLLAPLSPVDDRGEQLAKDLYEALVADIRVTAASEASAVPGGEWWRPLFFNETREELARDSRTSVWRREVRGQVFNTPFELWIHVPTKNQDDWQGHESEVEDYLVLWDGRVLMIFWEHEESTFIPRAGGHVVVDILRDAAAKVGCDLFVQGCRLGCDYGYAHTAIRTHTHSLEEFQFKVEPCKNDRREVEMCLPEGLALAEAGNLIYDELRQALSAFTRMKNSARRVSTLEVAARELESGLLNGKRELRDRPPWSWRFLRPLSDRLHRIFKAPARRREIRECVEDLWMALSSLEAEKGAWADIRFHFEDVVEHASLQALFSIDHENDVAMMQDMQTTTVEAFAEQMDRSLDNRRIAVATAVGGLAGFAGGLLAMILN